MLKLLTAVVAVTLLGACGSDEVPGSPEKGTVGSEVVNGEDGLIPITFSRAQDSTMETNIFAKMEGATYEENIWTDLIAERLGYDVKYLWIVSSDVVS